MPKHIAIIGAGPIGLEAALLGIRKGYQVSVYEAGDVANNVRAWGHVRLFSPFGINSSPWGRAALGELPNDDALLTGQEFSDGYLQRIAALKAMRDSVFEGHAVQAVSRVEFGKRDQVGKKSRLDSPFQLLILDKSTNEEFVCESDFVFDCSGVYQNHNWLGAGGMPAIGERSGFPIEYRLPDVLGDDKETYAGRRVLVVGNGYSAATTVLALIELQATRPETYVIWVTRDRLELPMALIENDSLPERRLLAVRANAAVDEIVNWMPGFHIDEIGRDNGYVLVGITDHNGERQFLHVDRIVANVGYRPDLSICRELQIQHCYATEGPMKLAASLMGQESADCMTQTSPGAKALLNPEPGYLVLGSKSYGRDSRFLMRIGIEQVEAAYSLIETEWS